MLRPGGESLRGGLSARYSADHGARAHDATVRVAAVQAMPVVLDLEASLDKALGLLADAAGQGAQLVVFPETFLSLYPSYAWAHLPGGDGNALWERLWASSVEVPGPVVDRIAAACR